MYYFVHNLENQTQNVPYRSQEEQRQRYLEIVVPVAVQQVFLVLIPRHPQNNEMGWACGAYGGGERCAQGFGGEA
jgi:hypothetical protein